MIYSYDGTFFGYLSAVFDAWHDDLAQVEDICPDSRLGLVFSEQRFVPVDDGKARHPRRPSGPMWAQALPLLILCLPGRRGRARPGPLAVSAPGAAGLDLSYGYYTKNGAICKGVRPFCNTTVIWLQNGNKIRRNIWYYRRKRYKM